MLIIYEDAGHIRTAGVAVEPRPAVTHLETVTETIDGVEHVTGHTTVIDTPAETEAECIARMIALVVPPGARHLTVPPTVIPVDVPPERWAVDWTTGTITTLPVVTIATLPPSAVRFTFSGNVYAIPADMAKLTLTATVAANAIASGVQANNLRWLSPTADFTWPDANGVPVPMDAPTLQQFSIAVLAAYAS